MIRKRFGLANILLMISCATPGNGDKSLRIKVENSLRKAHGVGPLDKNNQLVLKALSYPSGLRFYTDKEILRIIRFACDKHVKLIEVTKAGDKQASIAWNFTQKGKGAGGTTVRGLPRFGATLTEQESGVLTISCGERMY